MATPLDSDDYLVINHANWESRVAIHEQGYDLATLRDDPQALSDVVRFDLPRLGDISGLTAVHLQCHIGSDTLSLARLGAAMTGLDFSGAALSVARRLARDGGATIDFFESDVYGAVDALGGSRFDLVYTGVGALCWLPNINRWAQTVAALLKPGGRLFIREGHPMLWSLGLPRDDEIVAVDYPYFETPTGDTFFELQTYVEHDGELASPTTVQWNHGIGEIITAVTSAGLTLQTFEEHQSVPWNPLGTAMERIGSGEYQLRHRPERLAASYTLQAIKSPTRGG
jgi:SAM-dependent methyltransferase